MQTKKSFVNHRTDVVSETRMEKYNTINEVAIYYITLLNFYCHVQYRNYYINKFKFYLFCLTKSISMLSQSIFEILQISANGNFINQFFKPW